MERSVEDRKAELVAQKRSYHEALFDGKAAEDAMASRMSREDLIWVLTGDRP
jgi:erythromycin esterase-like protein